MPFVSLILFHALATFGAADAVGTFQVNAYAQDGRLLGPAFQVDIKPRRTINTTTIFSIAAPGLVPPNVPTQASLLDELNRIFPRQTNVTFTSVLDGGQYNYNYDSDRDGALYYDEMRSRNGNMVGCYPDDPACRTNRSELGPPFDIFYAAGQHNRGDASDFQIFYVNRISRNGVGGYSVAGNPKEPAILRTEFAVQRLPANYRENLTAHEIGHILGEGARFPQPNRNGVLVSIEGSHHNRRGNDFLMWSNNKTALRAKFRGMTGT